MLLLTLSQVDGKTIEPVGMVLGRYPAISEGLEKAQAKMVENAESLGADAVIDIRLAATSSEVAIYGTAVKIRD